MLNNHRSNVNEKSYKKVNIKNLQEEFLIPAMLTLKITEDDMEREHRKQLEKRCKNQSCPNLSWPQAQGSLWPLGQKTFLLGHNSKLFLFPRQCNQINPIIIWVFYREKIWFYKLQFWSLKKCIYYKYFRGILYIF